MRYLSSAVLFGIGFVGVAAGLQKPASPPEVTLLIGGDTNGYLSPCGCTKPMTGGILRRVTALRSLGPAGKTIILENGGLSGETGRQQEMKAEAVASALKSAGVTAINLTLQDARLGRGLVASIARLSGGRLVASAIEVSATNPTVDGVVHAPLLVGGITSDNQVLAASLREVSIGWENAARSVLARANKLGLSPVMMVGGDEAFARQIAAAFPQFRLLIFRSAGDPPPAPIRVGGCWLVTPGEKGKFVVKVEWKAGAPASYRVAKLTPSFADDPAALRLYRDYLARVDQERLIERVPRDASEPFAGTATCGSCHAEALNVWKRSSHASALGTLEREGHGKDPDCVSCHVVALDKVGGFRDRTSTPQLANVGCESCHGPGKAHSLSPSTERMGTIGAAACRKCHNSDHSPGFEFASYWRQIVHK